MLTVSVSSVQYIYLLQLQALSLRQFSAVYIFQLQALTPVDTSSVNSVQSVHVYSYLFECPAPTMCSHLLAESVHGDLNPNFRLKQDETNNLDREKEVKVSFSLT